jgi:hypothetical protein
MGQELKGQVYLKDVLFQVMRNDSMFACWNEPVERETLMRQEKIAPVIHGCPPDSQKLLVYCSSF